MNKAFWESNDTATLQTKSSDWDHRVLEFLEPINVSYALRFAAAHQAVLVVSNPDHDVAGCNLYNTNLAKIDVLVAIAQEIDSKK